MDVQEFAQKVRQRIEAVLQWAAAPGQGLLTWAVATPDDALETLAAIVAIIGAVAGNS